MIIINKPNPNFSTRKRPIKGIIIHSMGEYIGDSHASTFLENLGLSAHYLIDSVGTIYECVDPKKKSYAAGISEWNGETDLNESYINIELLIEGDHTYESFLEAIKDPNSFTGDHYQSCISLCKQLMNTYQIPLENIVRHSDVSGDDVRGKGKGKKDVGSGWKHNAFKSLL